MGTFQNRTILGNSSKNTTMSFPKIFWSGIHASSKRLSKSNPGFYRLVRGTFFPSASHIPCLLTACCTKPYRCGALRKKVRHSKRKCDASAVSNTGLLLLRCLNQNVDSGSKDCRNDGWSVRYKTDNFETCLKTYFNSFLCVLATLREKFFLVPACPG